MPKLTIHPVTSYSSWHWVFLREHGTLMHLPEAFDQHPGLH